MMNVMIKLLFHTLKQTKNINLIERLSDVQREEIENDRVLSATPSFPKILIYYRRSVLGIEK